MEEDTKQVATDAKHLGYLRSAYLIYAALNACASVFGLALVVMGLTEARVPMAEGDAQLHEAFGVAMVVSGILISIVLGALAALYFRVAKALDERNMRTFCIVIAVLTMFSVPVGTVLGLLTLLVLQRPSVQRSFAPNSRAVLAPPEQTSV